MEEILVPIKGEEPVVKSLGKQKSFGSDQDLNVHYTGNEDTLEYRIKVLEQGAGKIVSLWHDINLVHVDQKTKKHTPYLNFVCEIPKFSR